MMAMTTLFDLNYFAARHRYPGMKREKRDRCKHCGKPAAREGNACWPFCSERCRLIDLGNWALERYRIAGKKIEGEGEDESEGSDDESKH